MFYDDEYETTADLNEAIYYERLDVDREQAELERAGNEYARRQRRVEALLAEGRIDEAVALCPHGGGYGLHDEKQPSGASLAAQWADDPRAGEQGFRCGTCGAHTTEIMGDVIHAR